MDMPERDGDGYLVDSSIWTPEIARAIGVDLGDVKWEQILNAREYYEEFAVVPPIRKFSRYLGVDQKAIFRMSRPAHPMKPITKYGGLPKPTGCV